MAKLEVTCGIFLFEKGGRFLICHPTGADSKTWTIPKGKLDYGETTWQAAVRELKEETGVILGDHKIIWKEQLPAVKYSGRSKRLEPFVVCTETPREVFNLSCESKIDYSNKFEIDDYKWVLPEYGLTLIHNTQVRAYQDFLAIQWYQAKQLMDGFFKNHPLH